PTFLHQTPDGARLQRMRQRPTWRRVMASARRRSGQSLCFSAQSARLRLAGEGFVRKHKEPRTGPRPLRAADLLYGATAPPMDFLKTRYTPMNRRRRIYEGKAKVLYEGPEPGTLIQHFKDDATAFNAKKHEIIDGK